MSRLTELFIRRPEQEARRPLGLRKDAPLSPEQIARFQKLEQFDLSAIQQRIKEEDRIHPYFIPEATLEFKRYMGLYIAGGTKHSVTMFSPVIDEVWHGLILHTKMYRSFGQEMFGEFLDHNPFPSGDPDPMGSWQDFETRYTALYGPVTHLWTKHHPQSN